MPVAPQRGMDSDSLQKKLGRWSSLKTVFVRFLVSAMVRYRKSAARLCRATTST